MPHDRDGDLAMLKAAGHSAFMALRIIVDARRGDEFALLWIRQTRRIGPHKPSGEEQNAPY